MFGILVEDIKAEFALSDFQLGLLGGGGLFADLCDSRVSQRRGLADRSTRKNIVAAAIAFWSLMTAACGLATGFWTLFMARTGAGRGRGLFRALPRKALVADFFARGELAKAMGFPDHRGEHGDSRGASSSAGSWRRCSTGAGPLC